MIKDLVIRLKKIENSERRYKKELNKVIELNKNADQRIFTVEQSKQELVKMRDNDYDIMKNKNSKLLNELKTLQKYYDSKVEEWETIEANKQ